ncbi:MAG: vWA domain-containing protein [Methylococcales bacterium]
MKSLNILNLLVFGWIILGLIGQTASAEPRKPLLMEGKKTLFERVLTRPGARVFEQPDGGQGVVKPAFTRYYVYSRKETGNGEWLEVGPDSRGNLAGWIQSETTVPWKQQISLVFSNPAGRERVLLFKDRKEVENIFAGGSPAQEAASIRNTIKSGGQDPRVVSIEPETPADIEKNFYLLPILQAAQVYSENGKVTLLEVASVSQTDGNAASGTETGSPRESDRNAATLREFKAAVVFVIDSTISMGPYIDRIKEAVRRIYSKIEKEGMLKKVKFGLIAYRSSIKAVPGLEYLTKTFVDPSEVKDGQDFLARVDDLKPASVSSRDFNEDAYSGLMAALNDVKWTEYGGRYVILITDAGAIEADEALSETRLGAEQIQLEAKHRGVAVYTLHLKTPQGIKNHAQAESQYQVISNFLSLNTMLYYPVDLGSVETFGEIIDNLSESIVSQVNDASKGKTVVGSARTADADFGREEQPPASQVEKLKEDTTLIGYAMQLAYLGRETGTRIPPVIKAWVADSALEDPRIKPTEVRVLLTKNQLSDTQLVVQEIVNAMIEGMVSPDQFFNNLRLAALKIRVDANQIKQTENTKLADLGLLGEYLEDLPYRREILDLDEETWKSYATNQQEALLKKLSRKLQYYRVYNADADRWISLAEGSDPGDHVYPVPIEMLP